MLMGGKEEVLSLTEEIVYGECQSHRAGNSNPSSATQSAQYAQRSSAVQSQGIVLSPLLCCAVIQSCMHTPPLLCSHRAQCTHPSAVQSYGPVCSPLLCCAITGPGTLTPSVLCSHRAWYTHPSSAVQSSQGPVRSPLLWSAVIIEPSTLTPSILCSHKVQHAQRSPAVQSNCPLLCSQSAPPYAHCSTAMQSYDQVHLPFLYYAVKWPSTLTPSLLCSHTLLYAYPSPTV